MILVCILSFCTIPVGLMKPTRLLIWQQTYRNDNQQSDGSRSRYRDWKWMVSRFGIQGGDDSKNHRIVLSTNTIGPRVRVLRYGCCRLYQRRQSQCNYELLYAFCSMARGLHRRQRESLSPFPFRQRLHSKIDALSNTIDAVSTLWERTKHILRVTSIQDFLRPSWDLYVSCQRT